MPPLPYESIPGVMRAVATALASERCFRFIVLTAARSGEARGARWGRHGPRVSDVDDTRRSNEDRQGTPRPAIGRRPGRAGQRQGP